MPTLSRQPDRRRARRAAIEQRLLDATVKLLTSGESFAELRIEDIAELAGISRSGFYDYFEDKRELLLRLIDGKAAPLLERVDELAGGVPSGPEAAATSMYEGFALVRANAPVLLAATQAAAFDEVIADRLAQLTERFIDAVAARIEAQQRKGAILPSQPRAQAVVLVTMVTACWTQQLRGITGLTDQELLDALRVTWRRATYGAEEPPPSQHATEPPTDRPLTNEQQTGISSRNRPRRRGS
jgi:AcrR family transcriptional regulator